MKPVIFSAMALVSALAVTSPVLAKDVPSATATFSGTMVAAGVGYVWGDGVLTFKSHAYPFKAKGLSAVGVGAARITGVAEVYHLKAIRDFAGGYAAASAGGAVAETGGGTAVLRNDKGVVVRFHTKDQGLSIHLAGSGVVITFAPK